MTMLHLEYLEQARRYIDEGNEYMARSLILAHRTEAPPVASIHFKWAELCEELGMANEARESYKTALMHSPDDVNILFRYACFLNDIGYFEDSIHYLKKVLKKNPDHELAREMLAEDLRALGFEGRAEALYPSREKKKEPVRYFPVSVGKRDVEKFLRLFGGREVGYAIQSINQKQGTIFYQHIEKPLSEDEVLNHIDGKISIAHYPLRSDNTMRHGIIEIYLPRYVIERNLKNTGYLAYLDERMFYYAHSLRKLASSKGIPAYIDFSGDHRYRLWIFLKGFVHFLKIKRFLNEFLENAEALSISEIKSSPLLPTSPLGIGWKESAVLLPFGINRETLKRYLFLNEHGEPYQEQMKFFKKVQEVPFDEIRNAFKRRVTIIHTAEAPPLKGTIMSMVNSCPVLKEILSHARAGRMLTHAHKVILFYSIGLIDKAGTDLHRILEPTPDYDYERVERQRIRLKPNPVSCIKIRELVPEITSSVWCNCSFELRGGKYPSPLLHVNPSLVPSSDEYRVPEKLSLKEALRRYLNLKRQSYEIQRAIDKLVQFLNQEFNKKGIDEVKIDSLSIRREKKDGKITFSIGAE